MNLRALVLGAALALAASQASAGTLRCSFTEPFFTVEFDSATGVVMYTSPDESDPETGQIKPRVMAEGARVRHVDGPQRDTQLVLEMPPDKAGGAWTTIVAISVNGQGSDGMSDMVFPFEGVSSGRVGGCETGKLPAYETYEIFEDIGVVDFP